MKCKHIRIPGYLWITEGLFIGVILCYLFCYLDGGFMSTYLSIMAVMLYGAVSAVFLALKRQWVFTSVHLIASFFFFIHYMGGL